MKINHQTMPRLKLTTTTSTTPRYMYECTLCGSADGRRSVDLELILKSTNKRLIKLITGVIPNITPTTFSSVGKMFMLCGDCSRHLFCICCNSYGRNSNDLCSQCQKGVDIGFSEDQATEIEEYFSYLQEQETNKVLRRLELQGTRFLISKADFNQIVTYVEENPYINPIKFRTLINEVVKKGKFITYKQATQIHKIIQYYDPGNEVISDWSKYKEDFGGYKKTTRALVESILCGITLDRWNIDYDTMPIGSKCYKLPFDMVPKDILEVVEDNNAKRGRREHLLC